MKYFMEDLRIDIEWLCGIYNNPIDEDEAEDFIKGLLSRGFGMTREQFAQAMRLEVNDE